MTVSDLLVYADPIVQVEALLPHIKSQHNTLRELFAEPSDMAFGWEDWLWAHMICTSRFCKPGALTHKISEDTYDGVLVPVVDMLNHDSNGSNVEFIPPGAAAAAALTSAAVVPAGAANETAVLVATAPVKCGCELLYCYGEKANVDLVRAYGFGQFDNPYEKVPLVINLASIVESWASEQSFMPSAEGDAIDGAITSHNLWPSLLLDFDEATQGSDGEVTVDLTLNQLLPPVALEACKSCHRALVRIHGADNVAEAPEDLLGLILHEKGSSLMHLDESLGDDCSEEQRHEALQQMKQTTPGASLCFGTPEEWEAYVERVKERAAVTIGGCEYATTAEGCAVACRTSQMLIVIGSMSELEGDESGLDDDGDEL